MTQAENYFQLKHKLLLLENITVIKLGTRYFYSNHYKDNINFQGNNVYYDKCGDNNQNSGVASASISLSFISNTLA